MSGTRPDVVVLSSVEWDAAWQRHHVFASQWAEAGHRVFFVENTGFREPGLRDLARVAGRLKRALRPARARPARVPAGVRVISPLVLPPTRRLFREANASLLAPRLVDLLHDRGLRRHPIVFAYLPTATTLELLDRLEPSLTVYDCVDNFHGLPSPPPDLAVLERALIGRSDLVLTTSRTLYEDKKELHPRVLELHHGVGPEFFLPPPPERPRKRLCYFGTLWRAVDYAPIRALAEAGFAVELIGPVKEAPELPSSVILRGPVPHEQLPGILKDFDALLLPYVNDEYNRGVIPAKTYECLATGRPVLSSPLPALEFLAGVLTICRAPEAWVCAAQALGEDGEARRRARVACAREHAADKAFAALRSAMDEARPRLARPGRSPHRRGSLLSGLGWIGALYGGARASTLLAQLIAGRLLGPSEYGLANLAIAAAAYLQIIPMLGFPLATSKLIAEEPDEERRARLVSTALIFFVFWTALTLPLMKLSHRALERAAGLSSELFALALTLAISTAVTQVLASPLLGLKRFAHRGLVEAVYGASAPLFLLLLISLFGPTHPMMIAAFVAGHAASSAYALWTLRHYLRPSIEPAFAKAVAHYAATATPTLLAAACVLAPARLFLNRHGDAHSVGLFSAYFTSTVQVGLAVLTMLQSVLVPLASGAEGQRELWNAFRRWALPGAAAAFALFAASGAAALAFFGKRYAFEPAWIAGFAAAAALVLLQGAAAALYAARDLSGLRVSVAGALLMGSANVAITARLVPTMGVPGAALSLALSSLLGLSVYGLWALWERRA